MKTSWDEPDENKLFVLFLLTILGAMSFWILCVWG